MNFDDLLAALLAAPDAQARHELLTSQLDSLNFDAIQKLKERADQVERDDARRSLAIGQIAAEVADLLDDDAARALAAWAQANAHDLLAEYESAVQKYARAADLFSAAGRPLEAARTSIGHMHALMYLGRHDAAQALAEAARATFVREGDALSLAKLDMNLGNLHVRLGHHAPALEAFRRAGMTFESLGETLYAAMTRVNSGNVLTLLDDFLGAEQLYAQTQPVFEAAGLRAAVAMLDHDIAFLQYARGDYDQAFRTFERARAAFTALGMEMQIAYMDLNESDLYLDLNLPRDALRLAERAESSFAKLGTSLEIARTRINRAIAHARLKPNEVAVQLLGEARDLFLAANNEVWAAHASLQRAEVLGRIGEREQAQALVDSISETFQRLGLRTKHAYACIVGAEWLMAERRWDQALAKLQAAHAALDGLSVPWLNQRINTTYGRVCEGLSDAERAIHHYQCAAEQIESIATTLAAEEHRTAFVGDKLAPYESLVTLLATRDATQALVWAERSKSRALVDLLARKVRPRLRAAEGVDARRAERLQDLRDELNWLYTRITRLAAPNESGPPVAGPELWPKIREREQQVAALWRELQAKYAEPLSLQRVAPPIPAEIQKQLPDGTALVEYFVARGQLFAFVVTRHDISAYPALTGLSDIQPLLEGLAFQLAKFQYGREYFQRHSAALYATTVDILSQLHQKLLTPLWLELADCDSLIIVPHGPLHALPFHALYHNGQPLIETHNVSYAPSAAVLQFCWEKNISPAGPALLAGIPDERTPHVVEEIQALARQLPNATSLLGEAANYEQLCRLAPGRSILHFATHGMFRPESPLLSGIRLFDRWLAAQDVYDLNLQASLVTLSACESGLGQVKGGDEVIGLVRGFLYAGAASLLVSLWQVADDSMTGLMHAFYEALLAGETKARALRQAQCAMMEIHPHPYFWAPLALVGNER